MKIEIALAQIFSEVERAEKLHPDWPTSPIHQAAIVTEEAGELLQASLNHNERRGSKKAMILAILSIPKTSFGIYPHRVPLQ